MRRLFLPFSGFSSTTAVPFFVVDSAIESLREYLLAQPEIAQRAKLTEICPTCHAWPEHGSFVSPMRVESCSEIWPTLCV